KQGVLSNNTAHPSDANSPPGKQDLQQQGATFNSITNPVDLLPPSGEEDAQQQGVLSNDTPHPLDVNPLSGEEDAQQQGVTSNNTLHPVNLSPPPKDQDVAHTNILGIWQTPERPYDVFNPERWRLDIKANLNGLDPRAFDYAKPGDFCMKNECFDLIHHPRDCPSQEDNLSRPSDKEEIIPQNLRVGVSDASRKAYFNDSHKPYAGMVSPNSSDESKHIISCLDKLNRFDQVQLVEDLIREKDEIFEKWDELNDILLRCEWDLREKRDEVYYLKRI
ncbi:Hypothetical predicted protein, partial [Olea europaea subsp. europaea]